MLRTIATALLLAAPTLAAADVSFTFRDSAPRDIFVLRNDGTCPVMGSVTLDLAPSPSGLYFDVTAAGVGVEVFQPLRVDQGAEFLTAVPQVKDGDRMVVLSVGALPPGAQVRFTADLDDSLSASALGQIRVTGSEIAGAVARVEGGGQAPFNVQGEAVVALPCAGV
ncbi:MAG: hypothetical protein AAFQ51_16500 [Pseudomonadota bacterium]